MPSWTRRPGPKQGVYAESGPKHLFMPSVHAEFKRSNISRCPYELKSYLQASAWLRIHQAFGPGLQALRAFRPGPQAWWIRDHAESFRYDCIDHQPCSPRVRSIHPSSSLAYLFNLSNSTNVFPAEWKHAVVVPVFKQRGSRSDPSNRTALSHFFTHLGRCLTPSSVTVFSHFCKKTISLASISLAFCLSGLRPCNSSSLLNNGYAVWKQGIWPLQSLWISGRLLTKSGTVACSINWQQPAFRYQVSLGFQVTSHLGPLLIGLVPTPSHQGNQYQLECHRAHIWDLFFSWSLSTIYLPVYLFQPSCLQMMLSFTSRHEKYSNRRAPYLTTPMTPSTDMLWNFKTPSLLLIYGRSPGMESLVLKKKTNALQVGRLLHCDAAPCLSIGNQVISHVIVHKHLGILLRQDLKWSNHIHEVVSKASRKAGLLRFMMHNLNDSLTIKLFLCYVRPTLEYASPLWNRGWREREEKEDNVSPTGLPQIWQRDKTETGLI